MLIKTLALICLTFSLKSNAVGAVLLELERKNLIQFQFICVVIRPNITRLPPL